jgi:predicted  nucleic acid-binding Zn-ribbon protein
MTMEVERTLEQTKALIEEAKRKIALTKERVQLIEQQNMQVQKHIREIGARTF